MTVKRPSPLWKWLRRNVRNRLVSGMLVLVPVGVTLLVMRWLFTWLAGFLGPLVNGWIKSMGWDFGEKAPVYVTLAISVASIVLLLMLLYAAGSIGQMVVGRRVISSGEKLVMRIPLVRTVYSATKQVIEAVSMPNRTAFKSVVLIEFPRRGAWALAFLTGEISGPDGIKLARIFLPTTPNPTTGFFLIMAADEVIATTLTVEEAFKMIISGGIVSPHELVAAETGPLASVAAAVSAEVVDFWD